MYEKTKQNNNNKKTLFQKEKKILLQICFSNRSNKKNMHF